MKILLVEDNPGDARLIKEMLVEASAGQFSMQCVERINEAIQRLDEDDFSVILLDLSLPDGDGLDTVERICADAPDVPVVVLTGLDDEVLAVQAVQAGAQDYLIKGQVDGRLLVRVMRYAIERHRMQVELRSQALTDDLTGLYNRRGFLALASQQLKLARRMKMGVLLLYIDLDELKQINDNFGHLMGDQALMDTAYILKGTFRESDIIARLGGDEFVVLAIETGKTKSEILLSRLLANTEAFNAVGSRSYRLSHSFGLARYDPGIPSSVERLLIEADEALYTQKQDKR